MGFLLVMFKDTSDTEKLIKWVLCLVSHYFN